MTTTQQHIVPITQYRMGKGRIPDGSCEVSTSAYEKFKQARELGLRITAELMSNGLVSLCLEAPRYGDFDIRICENGPGDKSPPSQLEAMLNDFNPADYKKWEKAVS